jgi:hypothetical protein
MKCSDLQDNLSLYVDGDLSEDESAAFDEHLPACPLCREKADQLRSLRTDLRQFSRPVIPQTIANRVRLSVREENRRKLLVPFLSANLEWIQMRLLPLSAGIMGSLVIGFSFLALLLSGSLAISDYSARSGRSDSRIMLSPDGGSQQDPNSADISPAEYARNRMAVAGESPSINPRGTLASISKSLSRSGIRNDGMVVVADVFSNGLARIAEVVEPSKNVGAVEVLEQAFDTNSPNAPFVPASMDQRSGNVRVVLRFQSVEVNSRTPSKRK